MSAIYGAFQSESGRAYFVDYDGTTELMADMGEAQALEAAIDADRQAEHEAEERAEFAMNWVMGGGRQEDIGAAWAQGIRA